MKKNYQTTTSRRATDAQHRRRPGPMPAVRRTQRPSRCRHLTVAIAELAGELEEGLLAFVVGTGLKVLDVVLESEATALAGERGRHDPERTASESWERCRAGDARGPPGADHPSPAAQR